jgi:hypothetical protein
MRVAKNTGLDNNPAHVIDMGAKCKIIIVILARRFHPTNALKKTALL